MESYNWLQEVTEGMRGIYPFVECVPPDLQVDFFRLMIQDERLLAPLTAISDAIYENTESDLG